MCWPCAWIGRHRVGHHHPALDHHPLRCCACCHRRGSQGRRRTETWAWRVSANSANSTRGRQAGRPEHQGVSSFPGPRRPCGWQKHRAMQGFQGSDQAAGAAGPCTSCSCPTAVAAVVGVGEQHTHLGAACLLLPLPLLDLDPANRLARAGPKKTPVPFLASCWLGGAAADGVCSAAPSGGASAMPQTSLECTQHSGLENLSPIEA